MDCKGRWGTKGRVRMINMEASSKVWPGICSRGVVARWEESIKKQVGGCMYRLGRKLLEASRTVVGEAGLGEMVWES